MVHIMGYQNFSENVAYSEWVLYYPSLHHKQSYANYKMVACYQVLHVLQLGLGPVLTSIIDIHRKDDWVHINPLNTYTLIKFCVVV